MKKIDVWFSFSLCIDVEDETDYSEIARIARPKLLDLITSDSIAENIVDISLIEEVDEDNSPDTLRYRDDGGSEQ